jgi:hypothetical protein
VAEDARYLVNHLEQRLAEDDRTTELGIVATVQGDTVHLRGDVASEHRRELVGLVAAEAAPGYTIVNEITVTGPDAGVEEVLS